MMRAKCIHLTDKGSNHLLPIHFSVVPQGNPKPPNVPEKPSPDYLREALEKTMAGNKDVVYDFQVQVRHRKDAKASDLSIENATRSWDTKKYPPRTVARIQIPAPQTGLSTPEHLKECEELVYTPWHALCEHQPIGGINRLRYAVYKASANLRGRGR